MTPDQLEALEVARRLAAAGIPVFVAQPAMTHGGWDPTGGHHQSGYWLPKGWQNTPAEPSSADAWAPGMALCAVMGCGLDLLDVDPRSGGDVAALGGSPPISYAAAFTPSGGVHSFIRSLGVRSKNGVLPGIDVKAGDAGGKGRGFAFIAPTQRRSKVDGEVRDYQWARLPDLEALALADGSDRSGDALARLVAGGKAAERDALASFMAQKPGPWADVPATLAAGRNDGVARLAQSLRSQGRFKLVDDAIKHMYEAVWPLVEQHQGGHEFTEREFEETIRAQWRQYPDGDEQRVAASLQQVQTITVPNGAASSNGRTGGVGSADESVGSASEETAEAPSSAPPSGIGLTDTWLAERVAAQCLHGRFLWARGLGWLAWDGRRWDRIDPAVAVEAVRAYFRDLWVRAAQSGYDATLLAGLSKLLSRARIAAVVDLCRGIEWVYADPASFDREADLLNVANGVVDLKSGELRPHDPGLRFTRVCGVPYVEGAEHEDWAAALEALPEDVRGWYQLRLGQAVTGHMTPDDVLVVSQGGGENGKTAVLGAVQKTLGDFGTLVSDRVLLANPGDHPTELMDLRGVRYALVEETPEARRLNVSRLKKIVGTPKITARLIRQDNVTFDATHSLFLSTNYLPLIEEVDHGTWRRLAKVGFPYTFRKEPEEVVGEWDRLADFTLRDRMLEGADGRGEAVLAWLVAGARRWYDGEGRGPKVMPAAPDRVKADTRTWRAESDVILAYIDERLVFDPNACVMATETLDDFNDWQVSHRGQQWSARLFSSRFEGHTEVTANRVTKRKTRIIPGMSRRSVRTGMAFTVSDPVGPVWTWFGVRFRTNDDGDPGPDQGRFEPPKTPTENAENDLEVARTNVRESGDELGRSKCSDSDCYVLHEESPGGHQPLSEQAELDLEKGVVTESHQSGSADSDVIASKTPKTDKAALRREVKRQAAIEAAGGAVVPLPALVTRDGLVKPIGLVDAEALLSTITRAGDLLTVDVETSGRPVGHADFALRTVQLGNEAFAIVLDAADPAQAELARTMLGEAQRLAAHSAPADLVPLAHAGLIDAESGWERMYDTVIPAKLADPTSTGSDADGLKDLAADVLGDDATSPEADKARAKLFAAGKWLSKPEADTPIERNGWAQVPIDRETTIRYAGSDVLDTGGLACVLPWPEPELLERERAVQRMVARIAHDGVRLDPVQVGRLRDEHTRAQAIALEDVRAHGIDNPGSPRQVAARLDELGAVLPRTKAGNPSAAGDVLTGLTRAGGEVGELASLLTTYRRHTQLLSHFLNPYHQLVTRGDGRARPVIYTLEADTGRMSSRRPNVQNIPREGGLRACMTADSGWLLITADFSSVEVRVMAALSQDPNLLRMVHEGIDLHKVIAEQVFGPDWTKGQRYMVKRGVFGWAYGGGVPKLAAQVGAPEEVMARVVDTLRQIAPGYVAWKDEVYLAVKRGHTRFPTYAGRVVHLDPDEPHKAANYCVQGTARELLVDGLLAWRKTRWGTCRLWPVHDEIDAVVPEDEAEQASVAMAETMTTELFGVPIVVEADQPSFEWKDAS